MQVKRREARYSEAYMDVYGEMDVFECNPYLPYFFEWAAVGRIGGYIHRACNSTH